MERNPYQSPGTVRAKRGQRKQKPSAPRVAAIFTLAAAVPAFLFWIWVIDSTREKFPSDQMIELGLAATAICIAWPLAFTGLGMAIVSFALGYRQTGAALVVINVAVLLSPLVYVL